MPQTLKEAHAEVHEHQIAKKRRKNRREPERPKGWQEGGDDGKTNQQPHEREKTGKSQLNIQQFFVVSFGLFPWCWEFIGSQHCESIHSISGARWISFFPFGSCTSSSSCAERASQSHVPPISPHPSTRSASSGLRPSASAASMYCVRHLTWIGSAIVPSRISPHSKAASPSNSTASVLFSLLAALTQFVGLCCTDVCLLDRSVATPSYWPRHSPPFSPSSSPPRLHRRRRLPCPCLRLLARRRVFLLLPTA